MKLNKREKERYKRQTMIFGEKGQKKLKDLKIAVVGVGGLGSTSSMYLSRIGIGSIRLIDYDTLEISNLNRQILYDENDIGEDKVGVAAKKLKKINSDINIEAINSKIKPKNVNELLGGVDAIVDGLDNLEGRYLINKYCVEDGIPFFHAACWGLEARITTIIPKETACLYCVYMGKNTDNGTIPVAGPTPGKLGIMQAEQVMRHYLGMEGVLKNKLMIFESDKVEPEVISISRNSGCHICGDVD